MQYQATVTHLPLYCCFLMGSHKFFATINHPLALLFNFFVNGINFKILKGLYYNWLKIEGYQT